MASKVGGESFHAVPSVVPMLLDGSGLKDAAGARWIVKPGLPPLQLRWTSPGGTPLLVTVRVISSAGIEAAGRMDAPRAPSAARTRNSPHFPIRNLIGPPPSRARRYRRGGRKTMEERARVPHACGNTRDRAAGTTRRRCAGPPSWRARNGELFQAVAVLGGVAGEGVATGEAELAGDVRAVVLDGPVVNPEGVGDLLARLEVGDEGEDAALRRRQAHELGGRAALAARCRRRRRRRTVRRGGWGLAHRLAARKQHCGEARADEGASLHHLADRAHDVEDGPVLDDVPPHPQVERGAQQVLPAVHGEQDDLGVEALLGNRAGDREAVPLRHVQGEDGDRGAVPLDGRERGFAVAALGDDLDLLVLVEDLAQPLAEDRVIVGEEDADLPSHVPASPRDRSGRVVRPRGRSTVTTVPCPGAERMTLFPPRILARSAIPLKPSPPLPEDARTAGSNPAPSSSIVISTSPSRAATATRPWRARAWWITLLTPS